MKNMLAGKAVLAGLIMGMVPGWVGARTVDLTTREGGADDTLMEISPDAPFTAPLQILQLRSFNTVDKQRHEVVALRFAIKKALAMEEPVSEAALSLYVLDTPRQERVFKIDVFGLKDKIGKNGVLESDWKEARVTYNTMPGLTGADGNLLSRDHAEDKMVWLGSMKYGGAGAQPGCISMESTPEFVSFLNADTDGSITLVLEAEVAPLNRDHYLYFRSKNRELGPGEIYPTLHITTAQ
jgi:hypothetical protein